MLLYTQLEKLFHNDLINGFTFVLFLSSQKGLLIFGASKSAYNVNKLLLLT